MARDRIVTTLLVVLYLFVGILETNANNTNHTGKTGTTTTYSKQVTLLMIKYFEVIRVVAEMKDCKPVIREIDSLFTTLSETPMARKVELEWEPLKREAISVVKEHIHFYDLLNYYTVEDFLELWAGLGHSQLAQDMVAIQELAKEDVKQFMNLDAELLKAKWKGLNLHERLKECKERLAHLNSRLHDETIPGDEVMSNLQTKLKAVGDLIIQGDVLSGLLGEISTTFKNVPETFETLEIAYRFKDIREEFRAHLQKMDDAYKTLKKAVKLRRDTGTAESISSRNLLATESMKEAYAINLEILEKTQVRLTNRARKCLDEVIAEKTRSGSFDERSSEL